MRRSSKFLALLILVAPSCGEMSPQMGTPETAREEDFLVKGVVTEALEGGPLVIRATLCYRGKDPVCVYDYCQFSNASVVVPDTWAFSASGVYFVGGIASASVIMKPGDERTETLYVHKHYRAIPPGVAKLTVSWCVKDGNPPYREIACPSTTLVVDVPQANAKNLARLRRRLENRLRHAGQSRREWEELLCTIRYTKHHALHPAVIDFLEHAECTEVPFTSFARGTSLRDLIALAYDCSDTPEQTHARLVKLALDRSWSCARRVIELFGYWRSERTNLPVNEFQRLVSSGNLWTRILLYEAFPRRCDAAWTASLLQELSDLTHPIPAGQFDLLLRDLDDDSFLVREKASVKLEQFGERVESQLKQALRMCLSPEAKRRVRVILDRIAVAKESPEWKPILEHLSLGSCDRDAAVAVLRALAKGTPDAALTKTAIASLDRLSPPK